MEQFIEFFRITGPWAIGLLGAYIVLNIVGEILEKCGKIVPEFVKIRKFFKRKREEKKSMMMLLEDVKVVVADFNSLCSTDNIQKRHAWENSINEDLEWIHTQIRQYAESTDRIVDTLASNTKMTEDMFVEDSRDRIISFADKVSTPTVIVSHEQFRRIFRIHDEYEAFLRAHNRKNGEVDESMKTIHKAYAYRQQNHCFAEDIYQ